MSNKEDETNDFQLTLCVEMEQHDTSYDGSAFSKIYNQGLREGIMEAQENLTKVGYWEGLKRVGVVTNLLNKYISALLVLDSLIQRGLIIKKVHERGLFP